MVTLNLNAWERLDLSNFIRAECRSTIDALPLFVRVLDALVLTEDEQEEIGFRVDIETQSAAWDNAGHEFAVSFQDADFAVFSEKLVSFEEWPPDQRIITMVGKFKAVRK